VLLLWCLLSLAVVSGGGSCTLPSGAGAYSMAAGAGMAVVVLVVPVRVAEDVPPACAPRAPPAAPAAATVRVRIFVEGPARNSTQEG